MDSQSFYGIGKRRLRIPLHAIAIPGGDAGESDDENLSDSDEEYLPEPQQNNLHESFFESDSGKFYLLGYHDFCNYCVVLVYACIIQYIYTKIDTKL